MNHIKTLGEGAATAKAEQAGLPRHPRRLEKSYPTELTKQTRHITHFIFIKSPARRTWVAAERCEALGMPHRELLAPGCRMDSVGRGRSRAGYLLRHRVTCA